MTVEERLRRALDDEVADVEGDPQAWQAIQASVQRRRRARLVRGSALAAVALVAAIVGIAALVTRDDTQVDTVPAAHGTTTAPSTSSTSTSTSVTTSTTVVAPTEPNITAVYPFASRAEADAYRSDPGAGTYFDVRATALDFARTYVGMPDPVVDSVTTHEDRATVVVRPKPASRVQTAVLLQRVGGSDGPWTVLSSTTSNIVVDEPRLATSIGDPVHVAGTSLAFEAVVRVEVRDAGQTFGQSLGATTVMGGGTEMQPFAGDVAFDAPTAPSGAVVFFTDSAEDGSIVEATVVPVGF